MSGDTLTDDYGPHVAVSHYVPLLRALVLGRPYFLCAQPIGPFTWTRPLARRLIAHAAAVTVRDSETLAYLRHIGIDDTIPQLTADMAFLLPPADERRANEILAQEGIALDGRRVLGISVSRLIAARYKTGNPHAGQTDLAALMRSVIEAAARRHDLQVLFVSHVTGPGADKDDRILSQELRDSLAPDIPTFAPRGDYRPEELKAVIRRCTAFCGTRMHANIAALSTLVPTVAVSYSHKTPGIMAACGMGDLVAPVESMTAQSVGALIDRAIDQGGSLRAVLSDRIADMTTKARRNIDVLDRLIEEHRR